MVAPLHLPAVLQQLRPPVLLLPRVALQAPAAAAQVPPALPAPALPPVALPVLLDQEEPLAPAALALRVPRAPRALPCRLVPAAALAPLRPPGPRNTTGMALANNAFQSSQAHTGSRQPVTNGCLKPSTRSLSMDDTSSFSLRLLRDGLRCCFQPML